ncbi:MAG: hypothetical protein WB952_23980 [Terriglobales bacterium]
MNLYPNHSEASKSGAYGVYSQKVELQQVVETLNRAGFQNKDICVLLAPSHPLAGFARDHLLLSADGNDGVSSRLIGWLLGLGAVVIPRTGYFIRSRDFLQALMVEPKASASLRNATTLSNLGIRESDAHRFAGLISETGGFIYVICSQVEQSHSVRDILRTTGAEEARCLQESPQAHPPLIRDRELQPNLT